MSRRRVVRLVSSTVAALVVLCAPGLALAQSFNGAITGVVRDSTGGVVADTALTLRNIATDQTVGTAVSGAEGEYAFRNLAPGKYEVTAVKDGFQQVTLNDLVVPLGTQVRADVTLPVGGLQDRVEVTSGTSVLNTTATQEHGITPETLQQLPLLMNSGPRAAAGFAILMPGVSTGGGSNAFDARINGGLQSGDEATVDGVSMQQGFMSQGGMVSIFQDFPMSPDMVSEVKVLTSNYAPEYGSSTSGQIMAVTRSGGSAFHGAGFIYHRDDSLKGTQWGADSKPEFNRNNYGANIGGPGKLPGLWNDKVKSFFFFNYEGYRQTGGSNAPTLSIPSLQGAQRRLHRLARQQRQPDSHLRSGDAAAGRQRRLHQGSVHGVRRPHAERDLPEPHQPDRPGLARRAAEPDQRRTAEQLSRAGHSRLHSRQLGLLPGPLRSAVRQQRPHVRQLLAPAGAGQVPVGAAAVDCVGVVLRPAELVGEPLQLGSHVQLDAS